MPVQDIRVEPTSQMMLYENNFFEMFQEECIIIINYLWHTTFQPLPNSHKHRQLHLVLPVYDLRVLHYFRILLNIVGQAK